MVDDIGRACSKHEEVRSIASGRMILLIVAELGLLKIFPIEEVRNIFIETVPKGANEPFTVGLRV